jgi:hypothetical protein
MPIILFAVTLHHQWNILSALPRVLPEATPAWWFSLLSRSLPYLERPARAPALDHHSFRFGPFRFYRQMKLQTDGSILHYGRGWFSAASLARNVNCIEHQLMFEGLVKVADGSTNGSVLKSSMAGSLLIAIPSRICGINKTGALIGHQLHVQPKIFKLTD